MSGAWSFVRVLGIGSVLGVVFTFGVVIVFVLDLVVGCSFSLVFGGVRCLGVAGLVLVLGVMVGISLGVVFGFVLVKVRQMVLVA